MVMGSVTVTDSTRILHHLEASVPVDDHPALVPCTSDTKVYQRHVYFVARQVGQVAFATPILRYIFQIYYTFNHIIN